MKGVCSSWGREGGLPRWMAWPRVFRAQERHDAGVQGGWRVVVKGCKNRKACKVEDKRTVDGHPPPHSGTRTACPPLSQVADGRKIEDKRVLVDVERGRTVPGWCVPTVVS